MAEQAGLDVQAADKIEALERRLEAVLGWLNDDRESFSNAVLAFEGFG
jgi:hypothetical protein